METIKYEGEDDVSHGSWMETSNQHSGLAYIGLSESPPTKTVPEGKYPPKSSILNRSLYQDYTPSLISDASTVQTSLGSDTIDDSFRLVGRSGLEIDNTARDHPLYHNVSAGPDGLYHCPWEGQSSCQHKPEKLKCNYE
jgi:hypothetical protein